MNKHWKTQIGILASGHGITDAYGSAYSPLLPALVQKLSLTEVDVGILVAVLGIGTSLTQVAFGYLADRLGKPIWIVIAPAVAAIFISAIGMAPNFTVLLVLLFLGGCGIAAYHPQAAAAAGRVHEHYKGLAMSIFTVGGTVGYACGPLFIGRLGLARTHWAVFPGLLMTLSLYWMLFQQKALEFPEVQRKRPALLEALAPNAGPLALLFLIVVFRACTSIAYVSFLPLFLEERGISGIGNDGMVSIFLLASAAGAFIGGTLSDHMSRKHLLVISLVCSAPFLYLAPQNVGWLFGMFLFIGGFILASSLPVNIILGQQMLPENASMASSLMMGLGWGVGGLLNILVGKTAELVGIETAVQWLPLIPLTTTIFALLIPAHRVRSAKGKIT